MSKHSFTSTSVQKQEFESIINNCSDLTIYASEIRYPNILDVEINHMHKAINDVISIREFIQNKLK